MLLYCCIAAHEQQLMMREGPLTWWAGRQG